MGGWGEGDVGEGRDGSGTKLVISTVTDKGGEEASKYSNNHYQLPCGGTGRVTGSQSWVEAGNGGGGGGGGGGGRQGAGGGGGVRVWVGEQ